MIESLTETGTTETPDDNAPPEIKTSKRPRPRGTHGGYRPGAGKKPRPITERPRMVGSVLPALPALRAGWAVPSKAFEFWKTLTETQLGNISLYVNRDYPLCNPKIIDEKAVKYIDQLSGPIPFEPAEFREFFLNKYGSGDYTCYFNEGSANRFRIKIEGLRDFDKYPPLIDWRTLLVTDPANKDFTKWARTHGYAEEVSALEKDLTPAAQARKEDDEMNASIVEQNSALTDKVIEMAERVAEARQTQAQTPPLPRESAGERKSLEMIDKAGDAAFRMMEKAMDVSANRTASNTDPLEHVNKIVEIADRITASRGGGNDAVVEILRDSLRETREELREMRTSRTVTEPPKTFLQQLEEKVTERRLMAELNGDDGISEKDDAAKPGSIKHMMAEAAIKNLPSLANAAGGIISALFYGVRLFTAKPGEAPAPPPPPPPPPAAAATPALESPEQELLFFLRKIEGAVRKHLNEWDDRDYPGADFADWLINADLDGRMNYDQLRGLGAKEIIERLGMYQPLAQVMQAIPERFGIFVTQFIDRDEIRKKQEQDDADTEGA